MAVRKTRTGKKKKKWTRRRIRRYAKAYFFRFLFVLLILLAVFLVFRGVKLVVRAVEGTGGEMPVAESAMPLPETIPMETESGDSLTEFGMAESLTPAEAGTGAESSLAAETEEEAATATESESEYVGPPPKISRLTISAVGDCTLGSNQSQGYADSFHEYYDKYGAEYFFAGVKDIFTGDDLTLSNLECVLTEETKKVKKTFNLKGRPEYTQILSSSSVEAVSLGNNHSADYGEQSLADTKANLDQAGVKWAADQEIAYQVTSEGLTAAIISREMIPVTKAGRQEMLDCIQTARDNGADLVIACCHWGSEKDYTASSTQVSLAHALIDGGADLVLGSHPHVLQGMELYKGRMIVYSLANFSFGGNRKPSDFDTVIYRQTFTFRDGVLQPELDARVIPCSVSSTEKKNDFRPRVVAGEEKAAVIKKLNRYTEMLGDLRVDENGVITDGSAAGETPAEETSSGNSN